jgi:hypothetical protein
VAIGPHFFKEANDSHMRLITMLASTFGRQAVVPLDSARLWGEGVGRNFPKQYGWGKLMFSHAGLVPTTKDVAAVVDCLMDLSKGAIVITLPTTCFCRATIAKWLVEHNLHPFMNAGTITEAMAESTMNSQAGVPSAMALCEKLFAEARSTEGDMRDACSGMDRSDAQVGIPAATLRFIINTLINTAGVSTNDMFGAPSIAQPGRRTVSTFSTTFISLMGMAAGGLVVTQLTDVMFNSLDGGTPIWMGANITMPGKKAQRGTGHSKEAGKKRERGGEEEEEGEGRGKGGGGTAPSLEITRTAPSPWYVLDPKGVYGSVQGNAEFVWLKRCFFCGVQSCDFREGCQNKPSYPPVKRTTKRMGGTLYVQGRTREQVQQLWEGYRREF